MINIETIKTPNPDRLGKYPFFFNKITVGNHISNNIYIEDSEVIETHIELFIENNKLYVVPNPEVTQFHVNSKICTAKKFSKKMMSSPLVNPNLK